MSNDSKQTFAGDTAESKPAPTGGDTNICTVMGAGPVLPISDASHVQITKAIQLEEEEEDKMEEEIPDYLDSDADAPWRPGVQQPAPQDRLSKAERRQIDKLPFFLSFAAVAVFFITAMIFPESYQAVIDKIQGAINHHLGWAYVFGSFITVFFTFAIIVSPIGSIRIGGPYAKPDFTVTKWFAISLCSGIGIGILFWGIGEPIYHFMQPPAGLDMQPGTHHAAMFSLSQTQIHWSIAQYCLYATCGVCFALMAFNRKAPLSIMSGLAPMLPHRHLGTFKNIVHTCCLFSICCTVIGSIASLIMMVAASISYIAGIERGFALNAGVCIFATLFFVASSSTGLKKSMAFLSTQNTRMFFVLLFFVFFCGPTIYILNMGTESFGYMLGHFFQQSCLVDSPFSKDHWASSWIVPYMACFFAYAPPIGLYLARLGKGRTVRQFLLMNVLAPTCFVYFWCNTFGSLAIYYQTSGTFDVWNWVQTKGLESTVIAILQGFPLSTLLLCVFIVVTIISFVTLVDPMTSVLATLSTKGISAEEEAPTSLKIAWGFNMGAVALAVITLCGINAVRSLWIISGVLILVIFFALCVSIVKVGMRILRTGDRKAVQRIAAHNPMLELARPSCRKLMQRLDETVNMCVPISTDMVVVAQQACKQKVRLDSVIGSAFPIFHSASGKAYCAFLDELNLLKMLHAFRQANPELTDDELSTFTRELDLVRGEGSAFDQEQVFHGVRCVASPIFGRTGQIVATVAVSVPTVRIDAEKSRACIEGVAQCAAEISRILGAPARTFAPCRRSMLDAPFSAQKGDDATPAS
ncbi:MAG: BCCT family transporter [Desulfovibrio sp.]|nr:BCCT family transporter [Desulfovibrio sp.]